MARASIRSRTNRRERMLSLTAGIVAHRGLHNNEGPAPENTVPAFQAALDAGFAIELDIQMTKDKKVVVVHDENLKRLTGRGLLVQALFFEDLRSLKICGSDQSVPLFSEVLDLAGGKVPLVVELKTCRDREGLCSRAAALLDAYDGPYCVESFDPLTLRWFRKNRPEVLRGQLSTHYGKDKVKKPGILRFLLTNLLLNFLSRPDFIAYNFEHRNHFGFRLYRKLFAPVTAVWTIKNPSDQEIARREFDIVIAEWA
ncbi:MAG: glycerophosphodiester phosphodiesterase [Clostridiales bacterium]|nr:glycerophosphodiester phosphodiesterase [Clostridiales bacterium]